MSIPSPGISRPPRHEKPKPFEVHESGALFHGTKANLTVGDLLVPGRRSNFGGGRTANHVYVTATVDAATWGAELAAGDGRGRIYIVEPTGTLEDDQYAPRSAASAAGCSSTGQLESS